MQYQVQSRSKQTLDSKSEYTTEPARGVAEDEDEDIQVPKPYQRHMVMPVYKLKIQPELDNYILRLCVARIGCENYN